MLPLISLLCSFITHETYFNIFVIVQDEEEIEPYSTYTQRVNTLYSTLQMQNFNPNSSNVFTTVEYIQ